MAFKLHEYKNQPNEGYRLFRCDLRTDIKDLPTQNTPVNGYPQGTPAGSMAFVLEDGSVWMLSNDDVWTEI